LPDDITAQILGGSDIDNVYILDHGSSGNQTLGGSTDKVEDDDVDGIGGYMSTGSKLYLLGCKVALGATGKAYLLGLAASAGVSVVGHTVNGAMPCEKKFKELHYLNGKQCTATPSGSYSCSSGDFIF